MENLQVSEFVSVESGEAALRVVPPHRHRSYTIGVAVSGIHRLRCRRETVAVGPGMIVLFNPGENHSALPACDEGWSYCMLHIDERLVVDIAASLGLRGTVAFPRACIEDDSLGSTIRRICAARVGSAPLHNEQMILSAINRIVSDQARRLQPASENHAVDRVCEYLRANLVSPGGLVTLGRIANLHPNYLLSVFVQHTGVTPQQFLDHLRVATAQELIRRGESLSMAAAAVGYSDQSHLTRNFRKLVGVTPGKYRTATSTQ